MSFGKKHESASKIKCMEEDNAVSAEVYEILVAADWEILGKKMLARAVWRGSTRYHINASTILARGCSIEDVISYIIQSVFDGKRKWRPDKSSLEDWLLSQVDSVMDWWMKLIENKYVSYEEFENVESSDNSGGMRIRSTELEIVLQYGPPDMETLSIKNSDEAEAKALYDGLFEETSNEPELQDVIVAMMDLDDPKPGEVADMLGTSAEDIYNRKKRLKRHLDKIVAAPRKSLP